MENNKLTEKEIQLNILKNLSLKTDANFDKIFYLIETADANDDDKQEKILEALKDLVQKYQKKNK